MIKKTKFSKASRASRAKLLQRLGYLSDPTHPHHTGKTILAARNYRCDDNSDQAFANRAIELYESYDRSRNGKQGNRSKKLFEEHIYSSPEKSHYSDRERELIEMNLMAEGFAYVPVRTQWHVDQETGRSDLHILSAGYTDGIPPKCHLSTDFGHGKKNFILTLERAERDALDLINQNREKGRKIFSAREVKRRKMKEAGVKTLAEKLGEVWDGSKSTITKALQKLGYRVERLTNKTVSVISAERLEKTKGKSSKPLRPRRYSLETLRENIEPKEIRGHEVSPPSQARIPVEVEEPEPQIPTAPSLPSLPRAQRKKKQKGLPDLQM